MDDATVDRMDLDALDQDRVGLLAVDRQVDQGVRAGVAAKLFELVRVQRDVRRRVRRGRRRRPGVVRPGGVGRPSCRSARGARRPAWRGRWTWVADLWIRLGSSSGGLRLVGGAGVSEAPGSVRRIPRVAHDAASPTAVARCSIHACRHHPDRRGRARGRPRDPVRPPTGGLRSRRRPLWRGGPGHRDPPGARPGRARRPAARHGRVRGPPTVARGRREDARPGPDGTRRRGGQGHRSGARRRRLPDQAVRAARADEPDQGAAATVVRRSLRRRRRAGHPPLAT